MMANSVSDNREHHWDALRAFLMLLGIPYHVAMAYRGNDVWIVNAREGDLFFTWLAEVIHLVRMPAFFVIAGYFAALLLMRRSPSEWLMNRLIRLGLPFLACLLTLNPLLNLFCEFSNFHLWGALGSWEKNSLVSAGYWVRHLWFIIVLLYLCGIAAMASASAPVLARAEMPAPTDARMARNMPLTLLGIGATFGLWQAAAIELYYIAGLATNVPQGLLRLDQLITYAPWFGFGWLVCKATQFRDSLHRNSPLLISTAALSALLYILVASQVNPMIERFIGTIAAITMTQMLVAAFKHFANRPNGAVQALVSGAFVIYLVHLPITAGLVLLGQQIAMPVVLKGALIMALTLALSWGSWLVVRASPTMNLLYNGVSPLTGRHRPSPAPHRLRREGLGAR
jgi:glucan biosynthesis protein C